MSNGKGITRKGMKPEGIYPVYGSNGIIGRADKYLIERDTIIIGRVGASGMVNLAKGPCWISDNAMYVSELDHSVELAFLYYVLKQLNLSKLAKKSQLNHLLVKNP